MGRVRARRRGRGPGRCSLKGSVGTGALGLDGALGSRSLRPFGRQDSTGLFGVLPGPVVQW